MELDQCRLTPGCCFYYLVHSTWVCTPSLCLLLQHDLIEEQKEDDLDEERQFYEKVQQWTLEVHHG